MKVDYDIHIHTNLSSCSTDPLQSLENIIKHAVDNGLSTIGISNHLWDESIPGASQWYAPQNIAHVLSIKKQIPSELHGVRLLIGCETEYAQYKLALSAEHKAFFDYVLVPHSHIHMTDFVLPVGASTNEAKAAYLLSSFRRLVVSGMPDVVAHPFYPVGHDPHDGLEMHGYISDEDFASAFTLARDNGVALELNTGCFYKFMKDDTLMAPYYRMYRIARECGCKFSFGSDAHSIWELDYIPFAGVICDKCGIGEGQIYRP